MWLQSVTRDKVNLVLNHGQHLDVPCLVKGKTNRIFTGIESKNPNPKFCRVDETSLTRIIEKLKIKRIRLKNAPQYLQLPENDPIQPLKHVMQLGYAILPRSLTQKLLHDLSLVSVGLTISLKKPWISWKLDLALSITVCAPRARDAVREIYC